MQKWPFYVQIFLFSVILFSLCSCAEKNNNDLPVIKAMQESLNNSNITVDVSSELILNSLKDKLQDPITAEVVKNWYPKAVMIKTLSADLYDYINGLKKLRNINSEKSEILFNKIKKYKEKILTIDSNITNEFSNNITIITKSFDSAKSNEKDFYTMFLKTSSETSTLGILTKLQNNIRIIENRILAYCHSRSTSTTLICTFYSPLVAQNSSIVKAGETIEIKAGIGLFSYVAQPKININGRNIELGDEGYSIFKTKAPTVPGKYKIPVNISFLNQATGKEESMKVNVEYTVAKECN